MSNPSHEDLVDKVAKAMHRATVDMASKHFKIHAPEPEKLKFLLDRVRNDSELGSVILSISIIDDMLKKCFEHNLILGDKEIREGLFGPFGPLSTLSGRLTLASSLGWIEPEARKNINKIRKIRNIFAHDISRSSFEDAGVISILDCMKSRHETGLKIAYNEEQRMKLKLEGRLLFLAKYSTILMDTICDLSVMPTANRYNVSIKSLEEKMDSEIMKYMCTCVSFLLETFKMADSRELGQE